MGRHAQELEAERTFELIRKEKEGNGTCIKVFLRFLFSQLGLFLVVISVAVGGNTSTLKQTIHPNWPRLFSGAFLYIRIEAPYEKTLFAMKQKQARKIIEAENYIAAAFWSYVHDVDTYNFSQNQ